MTARASVADTINCECERWRNGTIVCPVHGTSKPRTYIGRHRPETACTHAADEPCPRADT